MPTEFVPGKVFGAGTMQPIDYCVALAEGRIAPPANLDIATIQQQELAIDVPIPHPAIPDRAAPPTGRRAASPKRWPIGQRSTRARSSGATISAPRSRTGKRSPTRAIRSAAARASNERIMLRELLRRVDMMVILENRLDALVRLHTPLPPGKIGGAYQCPDSYASCAPNRCTVRMRV